MTDQVIGRGVIEVAADATKLKAGINEAKTSLQNLKDAAKSAGESLTGQSANYLKSLERQAAALERQSATFGKSKAEIAAYNAAQLGVANTASAMVQRIATAEKALRDQAAAAKEAASEAIKLASAQSKTTVSAAQTAAALRGVPAQFTDIVTSLQGGQNPMTVLLQQGGQLKDMFGGVGAAAKALGSYIIGLVNPITIAAAAAGALAVAFYQGSKESAAFQKAIIMTGNYAGQTVGTLTEMSKSISQNIGTQSQAASVLEKLASSGKVAGRSLQDVATAAIQLERTTGQAIEKTVDQFTDLADEPTKAIAKLNDSLHFLSAATYQRIAELEDQGRKEEAAALAQQTYAQAIDQRTREVEKSLGILPRAWKSVADAAASAWNAMLGVGREDTLESKLAAVRDKLTQGGRSGVSALARDVDTNPRSSSFGKSQLQVLQDQEKSLVAQIAAQKTAAAEAQKTAQVQQAGRVAVDAINKAIESSATKQQKMNKELADAKVQFDNLRKADPNSPLLAQEDKVFANIRKKYKEAAKPVRDNAATRMLETLKEQDAVFKAQLDGTAKLSASEQARVKFVEMIDNLKGKTLTKDQQDLLNAKAAILAQLDQNVAHEKAVQLREREAKASARLQSTIDAINVSMEESIRGRQEQYDRARVGLGMTDQGRQQLLEQESIYKEFQNRQTKLKQDAQAGGLLGSDAYKDEVAKIQAKLGESLNNSTAYWAQIKKDQADGALGMQRALSQYAASADNTMQQVQDLTSNTLKGLEDVFARFATTGKLSFTALGNSFIETLVRMEIRAATSSLLKSESGAGLIGGLIKFLGGGNSAYTAAANMSGGDSLDALINLTGGFGTMGKRAAGGPVSAGGTYLVGEKGPEILRMGSQGGSITPNDQIGGGASFNPTYNIGSNVSRNDVLQAVQIGNQATKADILDFLRRRKVIA